MPFPYSSYLNRLIKIWHASRRPVIGPVFILSKIVQVNDDGGLSCVGGSQ